jgi:glutamate racemase
MKLGVFDSGVGGLSVANSIIKSNLFEHIVYYGDTARVPYGSKSPQTIIKYSLEALDFFKSHNVDMIITACNSVSAYALGDLMKASSIPLFGVIKPGIQATINHAPSKNSKILIIGTKATISSKLYESGLRDAGFENLLSIATPLFVPLVEEGLCQGDVLESIMRHYFDGLDGIDTVILGCTHFPFISDEISKYFGGVKTIHSGDAIVEYLKTKYDFKEQFEDTTVELFSSDKSSDLKSFLR